MRLRYHCFSSHVLVMAAHQYRNCSKFTFGWLTTGDARTWTRSRPRSRSSEWAVDTLLDVHSPTLSIGMCSTSWITTRRMWVLDGCGGWQLGFSGMTEAPSPPRPDPYPNHPHPADAHCANSCVGWYEGCGGKRWHRSGPRGGLDDVLWHRPTQPQAATTTCPRHRQRRAPRPSALSRSLGGCTARALPRVRGRAGGSDGRHPGGARAVQPLPGRPAHAVPERGAGPGWSGPGTVRCSPWR